ncbi:MAG: hypothetical protein H8M99_03345 [Gloeobacteraceae cyanobacterium ES-bin-144]|nr:hypothetical protein [Verrucomicrobiales bacterium]
MTIGNAMNTASMVEPTQWFLTVWPDTHRPCMAVVTALVTGLLIVSATSEIHTMSRKPKPPPKPLQWRLECLGHSLIEWLASLLPSAWAFRLGVFFSALVWPFMPLRRKTILRNLRIAYAGEKELPELRRMAKQTFCRTGANLVSAAHTAALPADKLVGAIDVQNIGLLEDALKAGKGIVLLLSHMGNWEILSRIVLLFPHGMKAGAFYRPLNNTLLDERVLARREADGTRMFSKRDNPLSVAGFLREGGIVGILADQRVGKQGDLVSFFGRLTRASPLPSLLARRSKSIVLSLSVRTVSPGKWQAIFLPVEGPHTTTNCMAALERAMQISPIDVFWFQERWKLYIRKTRTVAQWLGSDSVTGEKKHRALIWLPGTPDGWQVPNGWQHPDVDYEIAMPQGDKLPSCLPESTTIHAMPSHGNLRDLRKAIATIDESEPLPLDFILTTSANVALMNAGSAEAIPVISLP